MYTLEKPNKGNAQLGNVQEMHINSTVTLVQKTLKSKPRLREKTALHIERMRVVHRQWNAAKEESVVGVSLPRP
jgi:hypothetical protein